MCVCVYVCVVQTKGVDQARKHEASTVGSENTSPDTTQVKSHFILLVHKAYFTMLMQTEVVLESTHLKFKSDADRVKGAQQGVVKAWKDLILAATVSDADAASKEKAVAGMYVS